MSHHSTGPVLQAPTSPVPGSAIGVSARVLPGPSSEVWADPLFVPRLLQWSDLVLPGADHGRVHRDLNVDGCPGCAEARERVAL